MTEPNELLSDIRLLAANLSAHQDLAVRALAVLVSELDEWLTAGNVGPRSWAIGRAMAEHRERM